MTRLVNEVDGQHGVCPRADAKRIAWRRVDLDALERVTKGSPQRFETSGRAALVVTEPKAQQRQAVLRSLPEPREIGWLQPERRPPSSRDRCRQASLAGDRSQHGWFYRHREHEPAGEAHPDRTHPLAVVAATPSLASEAESGRDRWRRHIRPAAERVVDRRRVVMSRARSFGAGQGLAMIGT